MEAFTVLYVLIFGKKTKILLCSRISKQSEKKMMNLVVLRKEKNGSDESRMKTANSKK